jgi:hypothetical protein
MTGKKLESAAVALWKTPRTCSKCGRNHGAPKMRARLSRRPNADVPTWTVRPVFGEKDNLIWGCEKCFPTKQPREDKALIAKLTISLF